MYWAFLDVRRVRDEVGIDLLRALFVLHLLEMYDDWLHGFLLSHQ